MRKNNLLLLGSLFLCLIFPATSFSVVLFDNFPGTSIDRAKWRSGESVREIDTTNHVLVLKQGSSSPLVITSYPDIRDNNMIFLDPNPISFIQAAVKVAESNVTNDASTRARIGGRWYNDGNGTPGTNMTGDIWAEVGIWEDSSGVYARWIVSRYTGTIWETKGSALFTTPIIVGTTYVLSVKYDQAQNRFTFAVGAEVITPSISLPSRVRNPNIPWKGFTSRAQVNASDSFAYVSATFDNVYVNDPPVLYDGFSSAVIDSTLWTTYEFVREIVGGRLRTKVRSSAGYNSPVFCNGDVVDPLPIDVIQAKVTPVDYQNPQGLFQRSLVLGVFYNDGTGSPGTGHIGDVGAGVRIGGTGPTAVARLSVWRYEDFNGNTTSDIHVGSFSTPITLGKSYILQVGWNWNKTQIEFGIKDVEAGTWEWAAPYTPLTSINEPVVPFAALSTAIYPEADKKEATIEAFFDDVKINTVLLGHYYTSVLKRSIDPGGYAYWEGEVERTQNIGIDVKEVFMVMAGNFFNGSEYLGLSQTNEEFVTDLYLTFFDRAPDPGGYNYWLSMLAGGSSRDMVMYFFMFSPEFNTFMTDLYGDTTTRAEVYAVVDFFRGFLNRLPDDGGFSYWLGRFRTAQCTGASAVTAEVESISQLFYSSAEYTARGRTNAQFIQDCYYTFMRRFATAAEVNWWVNELNTGTRYRDQVRRDFIGSTEFQGRVNAMIAQGCYSP